MLRSDNTAERDAEILNKYTGRLARYTFFLAVATAVTMAASIWLGLSTRDLRNFAEQQEQDLKRQIELTNDAVKAANNQAEAAKAANEISKAALLNSSDAAKKQIRAYIVFTNREITEILQKEMSETNTIKNVGLTPANEVTFFVGFQFVDFPFKNDQATDIIDVSNHSHQLANSKVIGSQIDLTIQGAAMKHVTDKDVEDFNKNKKAFVTEGVVFYRDIYGDRHITRFCDFYILAGRFDRSEVCAQFNDAD